jgi:hypothetical protein
MILKIFSPKKICDFYSKQSHLSRKKMSKHWFSRRMSIISPKIDENRRNHSSDPSFKIGQQHVLKRMSSPCIFQPYKRQSWDIIYQLILKTWFVLLNRINSKQSGMNRGSEKNVLFFTLTFLWRTKKFFFPVRANFMKTTQTVLPEGIFSNQIWVNFGRPLNGRSVFLGPFCIF